MRNVYLAGFLALVFTGSASAAGRYFEVHYPPSSKPAELQLGVTYTLWMPDGVTRYRGRAVGTLGGF